MTDDRKFGHLYRNEACECCGRPWEKLGEESDDKKTIRELEEKLSRGVKFEAEMRVKMVGWNKNVNGYSQAYIEGFQAAWHACVDAVAKS